MPPMSMATVCWTCTSPILDFELNRLYLNNGDKTFMLNKVAARVADPISSGMTRSRCLTWG